MISKNTKIILLIFFAMVLSSLACKQQITRFDQITLERTICFGPCPIYKLSIWSDGMVQYEGNDHVKIKGIAKSQISAQQIAQLIEAIKTVNFFSLRDKYQGIEDGCRGVATDFPSVIISIKTVDRQKTVDHYHGCFSNFDPYTVYPTSLVEFENKIDDIVGTSKWVGEN